MTTDELRAEAEMVQQEAGGELTTRASLLLGAAEMIDLQAAQAERWKALAEGFRDVAAMNLKSADAFRSACNDLSVILDKAIREHRA